MLQQAQVMLVVDKRVPLQIPIVERTYTIFANLTSTLHRELDFKTLDFKTLVRNSACRQKSCSFLFGLSAPQPHV